MLATANPVEYEGTYPLPEAQLDRFLMRVSFGYPTRDQEWDVLQRRLDRRQEAQQLDAGHRRGRAAAACRRRSRRSTVEESVGRYCVALAAGHPRPPAGADGRPRRAARSR